MLSYRVSYSLGSLHMEKEDKVSCRVCPSSEGNMLDSLSKPEIWVDFLMGDCLEI